MDIQPDNLPENNYFTVHHIKNKTISAFRICLLNLRCNYISKLFCTKQITGRKRCDTRHTNNQIPIVERSASPWCQGLCSLKAQRLGGRLSFEHDCLLNFLWFLVIAENSKETAD